MPNDYTIACYYFPNYHVDPRNEAAHGPGWTEWELVKRAEPRFTGHRQPRVPAWGYEDESDPQAMAQKIAAAADHGVDVFLFDWYHYDDGPFLERGLERGFFGAENNSKIKFALMWANHNWVDIHPAKISTTSRTAPLLYGGAVSRAGFDRICDLVIERYFKHPSYWLIDGCPYFSIYELHTLIEGLGGLEATAAALAAFRAKVKAAGFPDLHLNDVAWDLAILPGETALRDPPAHAQGARLRQHHLLRLDPPCAHAGFPGDTLCRGNGGRRRGLGAHRAQTFDLPYFPNVTMGWDSSPRTVQSDVFINAGYPVHTLPLRQHAGSLPGGAGAGQGVPGWPAGRAQDPDDQRVERVDGRQLPGAGYGAWDGLSGSDSRCVCWVTRTFCVILSSRCRAAA